MEKQLSLVTEFLMLEALAEEDKEAFSAINLNPAVTWTKFVLTDDRPNANKQRVPAEEFENLIKTGVYMPIKMAQGGIKDGHDESRPIGVITHLKKFKNQVIGLAALWSKENPEDVELVKSMYNDKRQLQLSWEILFANSNLTEEGVEELRDTALRAVTLVGMPAYEGRTPILEVAGKHEDKLEDESMEELEKLLKENAELKVSLGEKDALLTLKDAELAAISTEKETLAQFKAAIDKEKADAEKLAEIKLQFKEAGIDKDEEYFGKNQEMFLSMEKTELDFMVQELVSFKTASASKNDDTPIENPEVPPVMGGSKSGDLGPKELAGYLRSLESKK
jgi:hypothetical protein